MQFERLLVKRIDGGPLVARDILIGASFVLNFAEVMRDLPDFLAALYAVPLLLGLAAAFLGNLPLTPLLLFLSANHYEQANVKA